MEHTTFAMGEIIREMRRSKGLTQEALSQAAGVSIQAVSKWETGQSLPDIALLPTLADFFGTTVDALFGREAASSVQQESPAQEPASPFPDDGQLRVVQYLGGRLMSAEECTDGAEIRLRIEESQNQRSGDRLNIMIQGSARIDGNINGALNTSGNVFVSHNINGAVQSEGDVTCEGNINGPVRSGGAAEGHTNGASLGDTLSGIMNSLSGLGGKVSGIFTGRQSGSARMRAFFEGELPDDEIIRVVQLQGRRIMSVNESSKHNIIRLDVSHIANPLNVEIYGSAEIKGNISGNASAGDCMTCTSVGGNATAGDAMTCSSISGNATAGDSMTCGEVGGNVHAGDGVQVSGSVGGNVSAGDSVTCGDIHGDVKADSVKCTSFHPAGGRQAGKGSRTQESSSQPMPDFSSVTESGVLSVVQVLDGRILSAQESRKDHPIHLCLDDADGLTVRIHGDAQIYGCVEGDVSAEGSVSCGDVEGDVSAGGSVSCGDVEGDVNAGDNVSCGYVEGDAAAGHSVNCGDVEGNVSAGSTVSCGSVEGNVDVRCSEPASCEVVCVGVEGNVTALNGSVNCGDGVISGNVEVRSDKADRSIVICGGVEGDVTVFNASVNCGEGVVSGNVDVRSDRMDKSIVICEGVEGSVTLRNASLSCGEGTVCGDIDAQSDPDDEE